MEAHFPLWLSFAISMLLTNVQGDIFDDISIANEWSYFWNRNALLGATNQPCTTSGNLGTLEGICTTIRECRGRRRQGLDRGTCGFLQICCVDQRSCGRSTKSKVSTFVNPTNVNEIPSECEFQVTLMNPNVCQVRIDMNTSMAESGDYPAVLGNHGDCIHDYIEIENSVIQKQIPKICGINLNQHVYVHLPPNERHLLIRVIIYDRNGNDNKMLPNPTWSLRITQLECPGRKVILSNGNKTQAAIDFRRLAPDNCLQYYTETTGIIKSFNYEGIRHYFKNNDYAMCFKRPRGSCGVKIDKGIINIQDVPACPSDYFEIPNSGLKTDGTINKLDDLLRCGITAPMMPWYSVHPGTLYFRFHSNGDATAGEGFSFEYSTTNNCVLPP